MTLRIVAGDRFWAKRRDSVREPTGSPVATKPSTMRRKISRLRSFNSEIGDGVTDAAGVLMVLGYSNSGVGEI